MAKKETGGNGSGGYKKGSQPKAGSKLSLGPKPTVYKGTNIKIQDNSSDFPN